MKRRLTLHLTARHNAALDRIMGSDDRHDNNQRRRAVEQLILDAEREPGDRVGARNPAIRLDDDTTARLIDRLKASRDRYRHLAATPPDH